MSSLKEDDSIASESGKNTTELFPADNVATRFQPQSDPHAFWWIEIPKQCTKRTDIVNVYANRILCIAQKLV